MIRKIVSSPFFFFPLWSCLVLWPLSCGLFTLKNDALTYYYPVRKLISDALHNGELPLWTPFINMGYPLHADMQSGAWNPLVLLIGSLTHYPLTAFHIELICYFSLAGIGFYYLGRSNGWSRPISVLTGAAYTFCGFFTDSTQFFVCVAGAAWIPFILLYLQRMIRTGNWKHALGVGIFSSLLLTGSYPALVILTAYCMLFYWLYSFFQAAGKKYFLRKQLPLAGLCVLTAVLLSLPAVLSFARHLPYIDRGQVQSLSFVQQNSFPPMALLSLLGPFPVSATHVWLATDPLMRNVYLGLLPLILFLYGLAHKRIRNNSWFRFWALSGFFFLLLAMGKYFLLHRLAYAAFPLFDTFRHPAIARLYFLIGILLASGYCLHEIETRNEWSKLQKWAGWFTVSLFLCALTLPLFSGYKLFQIENSSAGIQQTISSLSFTQRILLQTLSAALLGIILYMLAGMRQKTAALLIFVLADMFIATQISLPVTIIGARPFSEVNRHLKPNSTAFPVPDNSSITENSAGSLDSLKITGSLLPFRKKIGRNDYYITPGNLRAQENFYASPIRETVFRNPVFFFADTERAGASINNPESSIVPDSLSANGMGCRFQNPGAGLLVVQQNKYTGWHAYIDGQETTVQEIYGTLMAIRTPAGNHSVRFRYEPEQIKAGWYISGIAWLFVLGFLASGGFRSFLNKQHQ